MEESYLDRIFYEFKETLNKVGAGLPAVSIIAEEDNDPYRILVSTLLSLRTRDDVTLKTSKSILSKARSVKELSALSEEEIESLIKPAGFYKRKAVQLKKIAEIIIADYDGKIPCDMDALMALPGVGIKTASLVLNLGFNVDAVCVDCHVHEIANRMGWVSTKTPEETEVELRRIMPRRFWIPLNELLVTYGQHICVPISPICSKCPESVFCPKIGVKKTR